MTVYTIFFFSFVFEGSFLEGVEFLFYSYFIFHPFVWKSSSIPDSSLILSSKFVENVRVYTVFLSFVFEGSFVGWMEFLLVCIRSFLCKSSLIPDSSLILSSRSEFVENMRV